MLSYYHMGHQEPMRSFLKMHVQSKGSQYVQLTDSGKRTVRNWKRPFKCDLCGMVIRRENIN